MSKRGISLRLDVSKIDKSKLYKGAKGVYLDCQVFLSDEPDQYSNHGMIVQAVSKEEKDQGIKGAILGNAKIFWSDEGQPQQPKQPKQNQQASTPQSMDFEDEIPFAKFLKNNEYLV